MLASLLYPYDGDAPKRMDGWLTELEREGCIRRYKIGGDSYLESVNWLKHQKIDKPSASRLPAFPEPSRGFENIREASPTYLVPSTLDLGPVSSTKESICAEPKTALALIVDSPILISLPTNQRDKPFDVLQSHFDQFQPLYPAVDVAQELRAMAAWLISNPKNVKTFSGTPRFINSWLSKAQNRSLSNGHGKTSRNDNWLAGAAALAADLRADRE